MTLPMASLHTHTEYSPLDSVATSVEYERRCQEVGITACIISDHGRTSGWRSHQRAFKNSNVQPILGVEGYFSPTDRFDKRTKANRKDGLESVYDHIILVAKNETGMTNINKIQEIAWSEGFYHQPRMDRELLEKYRDGIIVLSACMSGSISKALIAGDLEQAAKRALWFQEIFGEDYYIELQSENERELNLGLLAVADEFNIKAILTEDSHLVRPDDRELEEATLILATKPKKDFAVEFDKLHDLDLLAKFNMMYPERKMTFENLDLYMAGREFRAAKLLEQGIDRDDLFENTLEIAKKCEEEYPYYANLDMLPKAKSGDAVAELRKTTAAGMRKLGFDKRPEYVERINYELKVIEDKGFSIYFVVLEDLMRFIDKEGIARGRGRGSSVASLLCYVNNITQIDPIVHNLPFDRFLDPSRPSWPDVDIDVAGNRRGTIKQYVENTWGFVANIGTINRFGEKSALKDAASICGTNYQQTNKLLGMVEGFNGYLSLPELNDFRNRYPEVYKLASQFEGRIKTSGMHAGGILVSDRDFSRYVPVETRPSEDIETGEKIRIPVVAYDGEECEEIGLIKYDILGVNMLTVVQDAIKSINTRHKQNIKLVDIPLEDAAVLEDIAGGYTKGLFQSEQSASTKLIIELGVDSFNDLVVSNALVRTGSYKAFGKDYIATKRNRRDVKRIHPIYDAITADTLGFMLYQEQIMRIVHELAGMSMVDANVIRRKTSKKVDASELLPYKQAFIDGCSKHVDVKVAEELWKQIELTSEYSFAKSHAVAYSSLTAATAWLKHYYPLEYMNALLYNETNKDSITDYLLECKRLGLNIYLPSVNKSDAGWKIENDTGLRMGLSGIKYISNKLAGRLIAHRPYESYDQLRDFVLEKGSGLNSRTLQSLNKIGAAVFDDNPKATDVRDNYYEYLGIPAAAGKELEPKVQAKLVSCIDFEPKGVFLIAGMVRAIKNGDGWSRVELLDETGSCSMFANENTPLEKGNTYVCMISNNSIVRFITVDELIDGGVSNELTRYLNGDLPEFDDDEYFIVAGQQKITKTSNKAMGYLVLADNIGTLYPTLCFPQKWLGMSTLLRPGAIRRLDVQELDDGGYQINKLIKDEEFVRG